MRQMLKEIQAGDRRKVISLIETKVLPHFNFTAMTASALGAHWGKASPEQKARYLPWFTDPKKLRLGAFALTEPEVGSDPARMKTSAVADGDDFIINGEKLWCTYGTIADLFVVMARHPDTKKISAFIVEKSWPGVEVVMDINPAPLAQQPINRQ